MFIDGQGIYTIMLHGHCKTPEDFVYDETRFIPIWLPEEVLALTPGLHEISVVSEQASVTYLGDAIQKQGPPMLVFFILDDDLHVVPQPQVPDAELKRLGEYVTVLDGAIIVRGKSAPAADGLVLETFTLNLPKGKYAIAIPLESG